jgi:hypothetical protein
MEFRSLQSFSLARSRTASRRRVALLPLRTGRACGPEGPHAASGDRALGWLRHFAKVLQARRSAGPDPRLESRLQGFAPRDESVAFARCLSAPRGARCSPGFRFLSRVLPQGVAPCHGRSRGRSSSRELGLCGAHARGPKAGAVTRVGALLGVLTTSWLARVRENTEQTLVRFTYLVRVLLSERAASPWLCVHLGVRAASPQLRDPLFGR